MKTLRFLFPVAAVAALAACSSSPRSAATANTPVAYVDPDGTRHMAVTTTEARTLAELPAGTTSWAPTGYTASALDATRKFTQTVGAGDTRLGTSVPMESGGGGSAGASGSSR